jgi:phenylpropionate dioxygenase-like ring-hydroxylating dioxygenase large terminal subunit
MNFNNHAQVVQSWYIALRSGKLKKGKALSIDLLGRRLAFFRDEAGQVHALDAQCPHLGSDLGIGQVQGSELRCAYHHWCFDGAGHCTKAPYFDTAPARSARSYPVHEAWGFIWVFNGPQPLFAGPWEVVGEGARVFHAATDHLPVHPHLITMNGMDACHFSSLHPLAETQAPEVSQEDAFRTTLKIGGRPHSAFLRWFVGGPRGELAGKFTVLGGNISFATVYYPHTFQALFVTDPEGSDSCRVMTFVVFPRGVRLRPIFSLGVLLSVLPDDRKIFLGLKFRPAFSERDECLKAFFEQVNAMSTY